jgi:hypothetical protein
MTKADYGKIFAELKKSINEEKSLKQSHKDEINMRLDQAKNVIVKKLKEA